MFHEWSSDSPLFRNGPMGAPWGFSPLMWRHVVRNDHQGGIKCPPPADELRTQGKATPATAGDDAVDEILAPI